jgi:hypothetical protein
VSDTHDKPAESTPAPQLPDADVRADFGAPAPGTSNPMPAARRSMYESRIRDSVDAQAAGAEKAFKLFIR